MRGRAVSVAPSRLLEPVQLRSILIAGREQDNESDASGGCDQPAAVMASRVLDPRAIQVRRGDNAALARADHLRLSGASPPEHFR